MKLVIEENSLTFMFLLENDVTGDIMSPKVIKDGFRRQNERHITILGGSTSELLKNILNKLTKEDKKSILDKIKNFIEDLEWKFESKEIYLISKNGCIDNSSISEERQSYINMVEMPDMQVFYKKLSNLLEANLPVQVPHITLFTKGERKNPVWYGIPIPSKEEFHNLRPQKICNYLRI